MFTGIIESEGKVLAVKKQKGNLSFEISASIAKQLKQGQSVAHNGVCLTVETLLPGKKSYRVTAVKETLARSNLGLLKKGSMVNLERSLKSGGRLDGHFVQGHIDTTAVCSEIKKENGSRLFKFKINSREAKTCSLVIPKGSIAVNGVSLTVVNANRHSFEVAIVPYTFSHTGFCLMKKGDTVNIEFDMLGKYIHQILLKK